MEAARDKWQNICTTVEHQTVAMNKKPHPRMAARNIEKLDGWGMELREAFERVELVLSKAIKRGVCKEQDEERLQHMNETYTKYSGHYKELLLVLDEATDIQMQAEPLDPEPPKKAPARTTVLDDPLDPRRFQARTTPKPFDIDKGYDAWSIWKDSWEAFKITSGLASLTEGSGDQEERAARRTARSRMEWSLFWEAMGPSYLQLTPILPPDVREGQCTRECIQRIDEYMEGNTSHRLTRKEFGRRLQRPGEPLNDWIAVITNLARRCKFEEMCTRCKLPVNTVDSRVSEQITTGVHDPELARKFFELPPKATLEDIKLTARMHEMSKNATSSWSKNTVTANRVASSKGAPTKGDKPPSSSNQAPGKPRGTGQHCSKCIYGPDRHGGGRCPAKNMRCHRCKRQGHMVGRCPQPDTKQGQNATEPGHPQVQAVDQATYVPEPDVDGSDGQPQARAMSIKHAPPSVNSVQPGPTPEQLVRVRVHIHPTSRPAEAPTKLEALPDTGSNVDVLPAAQLSLMGMTREDLGNWKNPPPAPHTAAGAAPWNTWGTFEAAIARNGHTTSRHVYVIDGAETALLSKAALIGLGMIPENWPSNSPPADARRLTYAQATAQQH